LDEDQQTRLHLLVDARSRLDPPLPRGFFGNGAFRMHMAARVGDVVSGPPEATANTIHEVTSRLGDEHMRSLVDFLELQEDLGKFSRLSQHLPATDLCAVSWLGLPIYEADFGWGRPVLKRRACLLRGGVVYILRNPGNEGGVTLILSLETESMAAFEKVVFHGLLRYSKM
ncbi:hypothetical protein Taro_014139, partial [Colocasia esculenta]|nr:hypothetical protein [Colocasia esculenta]